VRPSSSGLLGSGSIDVEVTGKDRSKYFQPTPTEEVISYKAWQQEQNGESVDDSNFQLSNTLSASSQIHSQSDVLHVEDDKVTEASKEPLTKEIEIQTMYRETETQTDPYSPEYILKTTNGQIPEIVLLAEMGISYGKGLPVGVEEIERIERAREKRAFEASLPAITDEASLQLRRKMLEEQEMKEWAYRENQIRQAQVQRLHRVEQAVRTQEEEREIMNTRKIESIMNRALESRDETLSKIQEKRISVIRKLAKQREHVENVKHKRDIIEDYANFGSRVYAPLPREGRKTDMLILQDIKPPALESLETISSLEHSVRLHTAISPHKEHSNRSNVTDSRSLATTLLRQDLELSTQLDELASSIRSAKTRQKDRLPKPSVAEKIERPPPRPPTPTVDVPSPEEEEVDAAIILLQRLMRGRAIQNIMYEGKLRRAELIEELKKSESFAKDSPKDQALTVSSVESPTLETPPIDMTLQSAIDDVLGSLIGKSLDFLSKELVRVNQERQLAALVEVAEKTRHMREAEESGRRQAESILREKEDYQFIQIMQVHQRTAETFIEQIMEDSQKAITEAHALQESKRKMEEEKNLASRVISPEDVINDLVFGLLFSSVIQETEKQKDINTHQRYSKAARDALYSIIPKIETGVRSVSKS